MKEQAAQPVGNTDRRIPRRQPPPVGKLPGALCHKCPLQKAQLIEPQRAKRQARLAVVMDAAGRFEVEAGSPLSQSTARQLWRSLSSGKNAIDPDDVHRTLAVACSVEGVDKKSYNLARKCCAKRLTNELDVAAAPVVMACGATALHSAAQLSRRPNIFDWRGTLTEIIDVESGRLRRLVMGALHPYFAYREALWRPVWDTDCDRIQRIVANGWVAPELQRTHRRLPDPVTIEDLRKSLSLLGPSIAMDVETVGVKPLTARLTCIGCSDGLKTVVIPWSKGPDGVQPYFGLQQKEAAKIITAAFGLRSVITHNGPIFDHIVLHQHGIRVGPGRKDDGSTWEDTLSAHHAFAGHMPRRLGHVVSMYVDVPAWKQSHGARAAKGAGAAKKSKSTRSTDAIAKADFEEVKSYNARDTLYTKLAWDALQPDLKGDQAVYEQDKRSAVLCREMQLNGFAFDRAEASRARLVCINEERKLRRRMFRLMGRRVNPKAPTDLQNIFFKEFGAPVLKASDKTGEPSLDINVLRAYAASADESISTFAQLVIDFRHVQKMRSTYIDGVEIEADGRVHPQWLPYGAISGRYSCQRPSLMNLSKGELVGVAIRGLYVSAPGKSLISFDFSQLEMRIAAYTTGDETMIAACEASDMHAANAEILFPGFNKLVKDDPKRKQFRDIAKQAGFAICYGAGADTVYAKIVSMGIPITRQQVEAMLERLKRSFHRYYEWQAESLERTMKRGYVESPILRRKRYLGHNPSSTENSNFPIQSGAADLMNLTLWGIYTRLPRGTKLVAQVHDQAIFEAPEAVAENVRKLCIDVAQTPRSVYGREVVFPIDPKISDRWSRL